MFNNVWMTTNAPHQKRASKSVSLPIELYEVSRYEDGIITLNKIESEKDTNKVKQKTPSIRLDEYSEDDPSCQALQSASKS